MSYSPICHLLEDLERAIRCVERYIRHHRHWVARAREWHDQGWRAQSALCLSRATESRQQYQEARAHVNAIKTRIVEACHD